jgi:hypothetical protein
MIFCLFVFRVIICMSAPIGRASSAPSGDFSGGGGGGGGGEGWGGSSGAPREGSSTDSNDLSSDELRKKIEGKAATLP